MTIRFGLGEFNKNNNVVSAPIDFDRLKSKQMLMDWFFFTSFITGRHSLLYVSFLLVSVYFIFKFYFYGFSFSFFDLGLAT